MTLPKYDFARGCGGQNKNLGMITMTAPLLFLSLGTRILIPPDRVFASIEKKSRKEDTIINPTKHYEIFKESSTIQNLGRDQNVYDWKSDSSDVIKPSESLQFKINSDKRIIISKNKSVTLQYKENLIRYKHKLSQPQSICKKEKSLLTINLTQIETGKMEIKPEKIRNVNELLVSYFGNE